MSKDKVYMRDLFRGELTATIAGCFYTIGKKIDDLDNLELDTLLNGVMKYQGSMQIDDFKEAFMMRSQGETDVKTFGKVCPMMVADVIRAYKAKKFAPQKQNINVEERYYLLFKQHLRMYRMMPDANKFNYIRIFNYCVDKGFIVGPDQYTGKATFEATQKAYSAVLELVDINNWCN